MKIIQSKLLRIGTDDVSKILLSFFMINFGYFHKDTRNK